MSVKEQVLSPYTALVGVADETTVVGVSQRVDVGSRNDPLCGYGGYALGFGGGGSQPMYRSAGPQQPVMLACAAPSLGASMSAAPKKSSSRLGASMFSAPKKRSMKKSLRSASPPEMMCATMGAPPPPMMARGAAPAMMEDTMDDMMDDDIPHRLINLAEK